MNRRDHFPLGIKHLATFALACCIYVEYNCAFIVLEFPILTHGTETVALIIKEFLVENCPDLFAYCVIDDALLVYPAAIMSTEAVLEETRAIAR